MPATCLCALCASLHCLLPICVDPFHASDPPPLSTANPLTQSLLRLIPLPHAWTGVTLAGREQGLPRVQEEDGDLGRDPVSLHAARFPPGK